MKQLGATLLELMVVLAVSAILLVIGIPSLTAIANSSRLVSATNELVSSLHLARSEAIKRNARTVLCPSSTSTSCALSGDWDQGWLVFHDANNNAARDAGEAVIQVKQALPSGLRATSSGITAQYISYTPTGGTRQISGALLGGTLTLCSKAGDTKEARRIIIAAATGRLRTDKFTLSACP